VRNHWLHPDKLGGGGDTDKPSIDKTIAKKVALSNSCSTFALAKQLP